MGRIALTHLLILGLDLTLGLEVRLVQAVDDVGFGLLELVKLLFHVLRMLLQYFSIFLGGCGTDPSTGDCLPLDLLLVFFFFALVYRFEVSHHKRRQKALLLLLRDADGLAVFNHALRNNSYVVVCVEGCEVLPEHHNLFVLLNWDPTSCRLGSDCLLQLGLTRSVVICLGTKHIQVRGNGLAIPVACGTCLHLRHDLDVLIDVQGAEITQQTSRSFGLLRTRGEILDVVLAELKHLLHSSILHSPQHLVAIVHHTIAVVVRVEIAALVAARVRQASALFELADCPVLAVHTLGS